MNRGLFRLSNFITAIVLLSVTLCGCGSNSDAGTSVVTEGDESPAAVLRASALTNGNANKDDEKTMPPEKYVYPFGAGVFSWDHLADDLDTRCLIDNDITEIYQYFKPEYTDEEIKQFLERMAVNDVDVYVLDGKPEWSYADNYSGMKDVLDRVRYYNEMVDPDTGIKGIVYDVEPYVLDKWHNIPDQLLEEYCDNVEKIKGEKGEDELKIYVCIPYSYDRMDRDWAIRSLVDSSDGIFVMNYYKGHEIENIQRELALAIWFRKRIVNVYELQPGLLSQTTDTITYYKDGLEAVQNNYRELMDSYSKTEIGIAYHTLEYLRVLSLQK